MGNAIVEYTNIFIKGHDFFYEKNLLRLFNLIYYLISLWLFLS